MALSLAGVNSNMPSRNLTASLNFIVVLLAREWKDWERFIHLSSDLGFFGKFLLILQKNQKTKKPPSFYQFFQIHLANDLLC